MMYNKDKPRKGVEKDEITAEASLPPAAYDRSASTLSADCLIYQYFLLSVGLPPIPGYEYPTDPKQYFHGS